MFYCEVLEISKNTFFTEDLWTTVSGFICEMLIFRSSCSQMFFKISVLKNFAILETFSNNKFADLLLQITGGGRGSKFIVAAEYGIYCWQSSRFLLWTPLKTRVKPQKWPLKLFCKKGVLRAFANFAGKRLCWSLFLIELQTFHRCFLVKLKKFLRIPILKSAKDCFWNLFFHLDCSF